MGKFQMFLSEQVRQDISKLKKSHTDCNTEKIIKPSIFQLKTLKEIISHIKSHNGIYQTKIVNLEDITKMNIIICFHLEGDNFIATYEIFNNELHIKEDI